MGFLQKFFSLSGKRSKRQWKQQQAEQFVGAAPPLPVVPRNQEDHEATINRLLRSSSANLAALEEEVEAARLTIPQRMSGTSTMSTTSLASTSHRSTYTVTVYPRTVIAPAQFPDEVPQKQDSPRCRSKSLPMNPITPKDKARLLGLRSDPSVASLLNMYDDHGCLDSKLFSNSPSPRKEEGRIQTQRTGSTLRELLGGPSSMNSRKGHGRNNSAMEGDISWAERWLCESADTSTSSLIQTPKDADAHFNHDHYINNNILSLSESHDFTINQADLRPIFSSMEVELSMATEDGTIRTRTQFADNPSTSTNEHYATATSQRASEVFGFLTAKKSQSRPRAHSQPEERSFEREQAMLAEPVQAQVTSRFSAYSSDESPESDVHTNIPPGPDTYTRTVTSPETPATAETVSSWPSSSNWIQHHSTAEKFRADPEDNSMSDGPRLHQVVVKSGADAQANRVRGPRPAPKSWDGNGHSHSATPTQAHYEPQHHPHAKHDVFQTDCAITSAPNLSMAIDVDTFSPGPLRPSHRNTASRTSAIFPHVPAPAAQKSAAVDAPYIPKHIRRKQPPTKWAHIHKHESAKENTGGARELPTTPVRGSIIHPALGTPPSPASSSDLSPVARQLMADLRAQRLAARPRYKRPGSANPGKWSTSTSKLKL